MNFSPYLSLPMGEDKVPYDLNAPGVVLEIKQALIALAQRGSDPLNSSDPIREDAWQHITTTGDFANAWDGPTADEFVFMLSRYRHLIEGPHLQSSAPLPVGIVGGPQPLARGLEVLAGAVQENLGGFPEMTKYLAWRDGYFDPPSSTSGPEPGAPVTFCRFHGAPWDVLGYTQIWGSAPDYLKVYAADVDNQLFKAWARALEAEDEIARQRIYNEIKVARALRDGIVREANKGAQIPECGAGWQWNAQAGACEKAPTVIELPTVTIIGDKPSYASKAAVPVAAIVLLGAIGSLIWWTSKGETPSWATGRKA